MSHRGSGSIDDATASKLGPTATKFTFSGNNAVPLLEIGVDSAQPNNRVFYLLGAPAESIRVFLLVIS